MSDFFEGNNIEILKSLSRGDEVEKKTKENPSKFMNGK